MQSVFKNSILLIVALINRSADTKVPNNNDNIMLITNSSASTNIMLDGMANDLNKLMVTMKNESSQQLATIETPSITQESSLIVN